MPSGTRSTPDAADAPRPFSGHTEEITAIEYSPDGRLIATTSKDATVRLWDPLTGQQLQKINTPRGAESLAFSPSGRQLVTVCEDATVLIWKVKDDEDGPGILENTMIKTAYKTDDISYRVYRVRFSNNCKHFAVMTSSFITLQDAETGQLIMDVVEMSPLSELVGLLAFASDDQSVLFAYRDLPRPTTGNDVTSTPVVYSFDLATRQQERIHLSNDLSHRPWPQVGSYDGTMIAGTAPHGSQIWQVESGDVLHGPLRGHLLDTHILCFSRDGEWLIDVSVANHVFVWNTSTGNLILGPLRQPPNLGCEIIRRITAAACSPLKDRIACADDSGNIHVWDVDAEQVVLSSLPDRKGGPPLTAAGRFEVDGVEWFPDGRYFISSSMSDDYIHTWDAETGKHVREYLLPGGSCTALSSDGTMLAAGSACYIGSISFFDTKTGNEHPYSLDGPDRACRKMKFSPNGSTVAMLLDSAYDMNLCFVFNVLGDRSTTFVQHPSIVLDVAFSPDGEQFAYITTDDGILVCSTSSLDVISKVSSMASDGSDPTHSISFSPDGRRLLVCSRGLLVLDVHTCQTILHLYADYNGIRAVFSPDGRTLLYSVHDSSIQMVDAATDDPVWQSNVSNLTCFAFSPGGERIVVGSKYGDFEVYEAVTGRMLLYKQDSTSPEGKPSTDELDIAGHGTRPGPSRRGINLADVDDDSIMNMPAVARRSAPRDYRTRQKDPVAQKKDGSHEEPRRGFIARLTSRRKTELTSDEPRDSHRRMGRVLELVSAGRANLRVMAAGPSGQGHRRAGRREEESDESSSSPSPPASTRQRVESPGVGLDEQRSGTPSSDGLKDILCFCLCIPSCHKD
ncbi:WD40 repeat-like protein [Coniophora puteana RWD-64-598 SS2]|uniref:WD40 repeat-like protein n=1 Tax=Coniophora puteana (strain RWD-64-598) TaxID=741705 RepID=A0A5M3MEN6_CONPW|nr:WD40 repeat-like protein [Coniophora puteana RWD-64-598 SS2]EIW77380.1 WD40 repeat-like protein [Coniophora puteana RWD-64-598 SS2]